MEGFVPWPPSVAERYRREGYWRGEVLGDLLRDWARREPDRTAVVCGERRWTYAALDARADRVAGGLRRLGLAPGDRVVVQLPNTAAFVYVLVALFRLGAVPVLALPAHRQVEIRYLAELTEARAYIAPDTFAGYDYRDLAEELVATVSTVEHVVVDGAAGRFTPLDEVDATGGRYRPDPAAPAFFLLSGGTTGLPKLIPRTHDDYAYQLRACAESMRVDERAAYLAALPVAHNAALGCPGVLGTLRAGGKVVLSPTPSPDDTFPLIVREAVTLTTLMPPLLAVWAELAPLYGVDLSSVVIEVGGAALRPDVAEQIMALGCRLTHWFGMAEGVLWHTRLDDPPDAVAHTQGRPLFPADEYRVVDADGRDVPPGSTGELLTRGPCTLRGYYRAAEYNETAFTSDGYLRTGDLVRITPEGNLAVQGRAKDVINRGGEKIGPEELERHIATHPGVRAAAVVAVPDRELGEKICAFVVPRGAPIDLAELRAHLTRQGLAGFKLPDRLHVVPGLAQTGVGKIDKNWLRELATASPTGTSGRTGVTRAAPRSG